MALTKVSQPMSSTPSIDDNGTATALTIDSSQNATFANDVDVDGVFTVTDAGSTFATRADGGGFSYTQGLDVATAGCTFTGASTRGDMAAISLYQTTTGADGGFIALRTSPSGSTTPAERMRIDQSGNVGIGTSSPSSYYADKLVVQGAFDGDGITIVSSATTTDSYFAFADGTTGDERYRGAIGYYHGSDALVLYSSGTERMRITSTGSVGIGVTNPDSYYAENLVVAAPEAGGITIAASSTSDTNYLMFADGTSGTARYRGFLGYAHSIDTLDIVSYGAMRFYTGDPATINVRIDSSGYLYNPSMLGSASANSDVRFNTSDGLIYYQTSSRRYKENIQDLPSMLDKVNSLRPVTFDEISTGESCYGLIAEEVFEQIPELVNLKEVEGYDEPQPDNIPYSMLSIFLLKAIQEQQAQIETLKAEVAALKGE